MVPDLKLVLATMLVLATLAPADGPYRMVMFTNDYGFEFDVKTNSRYLWFRCGAGSYRFPLADAVFQTCHDIDELAYASYLVKDPAAPMDPPRFIVLGMPPAWMVQGMELTFSRDGVPDVTYRITDVISPGQGQMIEHDPR